MSRTRNLRSHQVKPNIGGALDCAPLARARWHYESTLGRCAARQAVALSCPEEVSCAIGVRNRGVRGEGLALITRKYVLRSGHLL